LPKRAYSTDLRIEAVMPNSPELLRVHVELFARYFLREMHMDGVQFETAETAESPGYVRYQAYLFAIQDRFIGAGCFRYRDYQDPARPWVFDWMWLYPYFRRQGHLTRAWPTLRSELGNFQTGPSAFTGDGSLCAEGRTKWERT
jgi:hypothetical protein